VKRFAFSAHVTPVRGGSAGRLPSTVESGRRRFYPHQVLPQVPVRHWMLTPPHRVRSVLA
jgi:hypothetical protein